MLASATEQECLLAMKQTGRQNVLLLSGASPLHSRVVCGNLTVTANGLEFESYSPLHPFL